jgi:hypothetical protein
VGDMHVPADPPGSHGLCRIRFRHKGFVTYIHIEAYVRTVDT